jgi:uncharacterized protein YjbI with pentapeptide repeats
MSKAFPFCSLRADRILFFLLTGGIGLVNPLFASAVCTLEREPVGPSSMFIRHWTFDCLKLDPTQHAVNATEILDAMTAGKGISLKNAVVRGDLLLTHLKPVPLTLNALPESVVAHLNQAKVTELRMIRGPFIIEDSVVDGLIDTQFKPDMTEHRVLGDRVVMQGLVSFKGTTFKKEVDLSRTVFLQSVDSSNAVYLGNAFFLHCVFTKRVTFEKTAFSKDTRFYQTIFEEPVTFLRAGFNGLTNFLSVWFKQESSFSRAYFKMGVGFSGSRFDGISDFSEALFEKAVFLLHTVFNADTYFRRATFQGPVSFSDAVFRGKADFSKVFYHEEPNFTRATFAAPRSSVGFDSPVFLTIVGVALLIFFVAFVIILKNG